MLAAVTPMKQMLSLSEKQVLLILGFIAVLRTAVILAVVPAIGSMASSTFRSEPFLDGYADIAWNILTGHGYSLLPEASETMFRSPGYVLFLLPVFAAFGKSIVAIQIAQCLLSLGTAYLIYRIAKRITKTTPIAVIAAIIFLLSPAVIMADSRALIESFLTFCVVGFILSLYRALETDEIHHWLYAGLLFGWILLIRSSAALFPPFLLFLMVMREWPKDKVTLLKRTSTRFGSFCLAAALVLSPWIVRNYVLSGEFEPTMTVRGAALFQSVYLIKDSETEKDELISFVKATELLDQMAQRMHVPYKPGFLPYFYDIKDEVRYYQNLGDLAVDGLRSEPTLLVRLIAKNAVRFWFKGVTPGASYIYIAAIAPLLIFGIIGTILAIRSGINVAPMLAFSMAYYISYLPMLAFARYSMPVIPYLAIASAIAIHRFILKYPDTSKVSARPVS